MLHLDFILEHGKKSITSSHIISLSHLLNDSQFAQQPDQSC